MYKKHTHTQQTNKNFSIAFKPAESGGGGSNKYSQNFDSIFNKKKGSKKEEAIMKKEE